MRFISVKVDVTVRDVVLMTNLIGVIREGPVEERIHASYETHVVVDGAIVVCGTSELAVKSIHAAGVSDDAVEDLIAIEPLQESAFEVCIHYLPLSEVRTEGSPQVSMATTSSIGRRGEGRNTVPGRNRPTGRRHPWTWVAGIPSRAATSA